MTQSGSKSCYFTRHICISFQRDSGSGVFHRKNGHYELIGVLSHRQNCGELNLGPLVIKDQQQNVTTSSSNSTSSISSMVTVDDLKMMMPPMNATTRESVGRQLHSIKQSDSIMGSNGDHYFDPLPVFTRVDHHMDWILENTRESCYCKPRFEFSLKFTGF